MRNRYLENFDNIVKLKIEGSNIHNYLKRLMKNKVNIIKLIPVSYREAYVILKYSEYHKLLQYKTIYKITVVKYYGKLRAKQFLYQNMFLLFFVILGLVLLFFLSRVIFSVEVIHQDKRLRELVLSELKEYDIYKYHFKKSYAELEQIEDKILEDNKKSLEWIEIVSYGTKYIVRVEERKLNQDVESFQYQSIVSRKNAVLVEIDALQGEKVKNIHDYVAKGETIISGYITLPNNTQVMTMAKGHVYGEVWYEVDIDYPFVYQESNLTGKSKTVYVFEFLNRRISLFDFDEYHSFQSKDKILFFSNLLGFSFKKEKQYEAIVKDEVYTEDIVKVKAIDYIKQKLLKDNPDIREFQEVKILSTSSDYDSMRIRLFVRTIEEIGEVVPISMQSLEQKTDS